MWKNGWWEKAQNFIMKRLDEINQKLLRYLQALQATHVTFQQFYRPCNTIEEAKYHFSGEHPLYGLKPEFSVLYNELANGHRCIYPGATAIVAKFQANKK